MVHFKSFQGIVTNLIDFGTEQNESKDVCYKQMTLVDDDNMIVNFIISPTTYFTNHEIVALGDYVAGYYNGDAPIPMIYPPQYQALIVVKKNNYQNVKVDLFDHQLVSSDGLLKLNLSPNTQILLRNGQPFIKTITNRNLIVTYGPTTRSIPAQTTPYKIIVWC